MRDVEVSINRRAFRIACEEEQEPRLRALARYVDHEVQGLAEQFGQIGDDRLLVMVSLLLADRLDEATKNPGATPILAGAGQVDEEETAELLNLLADRLERMAARLELAIEVSDGAVAQVKRDLRQRLLAARVGLFQAAPDAGAAIRDNFLDAIDPPSGATVAAYWPMGAEADPRPLFEALGARGHPLALPVVVKAGRPLAFRAWAPGEPLVPAGFGTSVPASTAPEVVPDVLLVPLLAFDRRGYRLGYGGGFYDRTIAALAPRLALAAGIAFAGQEVDAVPTEGFDRRLDRIVTEREVVICRP